jgi:hypothetical protein
MDVMKNEEGGAAAALVMVVRKKSSLGWRWSKPTTIGFDAMLRQ